MMKILFSVQIHSVTVDPNLIMTNIFNNLSEIIGVLSAFIVFFVLKSIGISPFLAFPLCMLSGWGIAIFFKNNGRKIH